MVPVVAPALLVRLRHGPGLRTLETCNMQTIGGRKTFSNLERMKNDSSKTFQHVCFDILWPFSLGPTLTSRSDDRAINHASDRYRAGTLWEHRTYFMRASEDSLPSDLIWLSDMPWAAAVVAVPIRKLCDLNRLGQKWQNCRGPRSCSLNLARVTGMLRQQRNKVPIVAPRTDKYAFMIWRGQSCGEVVPFIVRVKGLPLLCLKWMGIKDVFDF